MPINRTLAATLAVALPLSAAATLSGCSFVAQALNRTPGGNMRSDDTYTYQSTPYEPLTLTLYDTRDDEPLWTVDVPVGSKITIRFRANKIKEGTPRRPDIMDWVIFDATERWERLQNSMAVPPGSSRLLKVAIRELPEYPAETQPEPGFPDPKETWVPVEPKTYRSGDGN